MIKKYSIFIILFIITVWLIVPAFETIDDFFMLQIVSGKYGHHPSELMLYSSPLYGKALMFLYQSFPSLNWYFLVFLLIHLISWLVILDMFIRHQGRFRNFSILLFIFFFATFGLYFLGNLQFTTTAFILAMSGLLLIMNKTKPAPVLAGILMVILAAMIRLFSVWFLLCLASPWLLYRWVISEGFKGFRKQVKTVLIISGIFLFTILLMTAGKAVYRQTESGRVLRSFIFERGRLIDNPNFIFTPENAGEFSKVGWSDEDYKMFVDYFFDPGAPFTPENLNYLYNHLKIVTPGHSRIINGLKTLLSHYQFYAPLLLLMIIVFMRGRITKKDYLFTFLQVGAIMIFLMYLLFFNDFKLRVISPVLYTAALFAAMHILQRGDIDLPEQERSFIPAVASVFLLITIALYLNFTATKERISSDKALRKQITLINSIEKEWLVVHGYDLPIEHMKLSIFNDPQKDLRGRIYFTMPSSFNHYLNGSGNRGKEATLFDLISGDKGRIVLLHKGRITNAAEIIQYAGKRTGRVMAAPSRIEKPGLEYDIFIMDKQVQ